MNYKKRIKALQTILETLNIDAMVIDNLINLYYLTGIDLSAGRIRSLKGMCG